MLEADVLANLFDEKAAATRRIPINPYKELRYLVVEDQDASRQTLKICIQSMGGFSVDQAQSFNEAVQRIRKQMPDVIICDYMLGNGRTGQQLLEDMRRSESLPETVAFLMVTAERSYEQVVSAVELAPDDYIIKPFSPEILRKRMDRVIRRKIFFSQYSRHVAARNFAAALTELDQMEASAEGKHYRFEILRAQAETLLKADRAEDALAAYGSIIAIHPFPWALVGQAKALRRLNRYEEANVAIDGVLGAAPSYFDAYDLKADLCCDLGNFGEAQRIMQETAQRTPRNWGRKRQLSRVAKLNGDFATARSVIEEVIRNDVIAGFPIGDRIDLVRTALASGDRTLARKTLTDLMPEERALLKPEEQLNLVCLEAALEGGATGEKRFDRIRTDLGRTNLPAEAALDAIRASFAFSDRQLADTLAEKLLTGPDARRAFHSMLEIYRAQGLEDHFRQLQRAAAARLLRRKQ